MDKQIEKLVARAKGKDLSQKEEQEFLALFHDEHLEYGLKEALFDELNNFENGDVDKHYFSNVFKEILLKIDKKREKVKSKNNIIYPYLRIAAILIIGFIVGVFITSIYNKQEPVYYTAVSPLGSVSETILPDGTIIYLNAGSEIKYTIDGKDGCREVFLEGEAWFDVEKNKKNPFVVHTAFYDVNVTGTQFNIKAYQADKEIVTTLEEGQVTISSNSDFKFDEDVVLAPGNQAVFDKESKNLCIKTVNTLWYTSWKDNKLIFVNMSLKRLMVLLERKFGVDIEVVDDSILDCHYDGTIKNESILEILEIIKKTLPINYKIEGQKIKITAN